jgi:hypothetical protein
VQSSLRQSSRKLQIGAVVELSQSVETEVGDPSGLQLTARVTNLSFNAVNEEDQLSRIERTLVCGAVQACEQLVAIERLTLAIAFDHLEGLRDGALVGGEAVPA